MSTISKILPQPPDGFSTQISTATVSSTELTITLDSVSGLPTEGVGQLLKKDADGNLVAGSVEFIHWTNVSGSTITLSDTDDRGITGSDSGAQAYVADDYFEVWVSSYYSPYGGLVEHNADGTHSTVTVSGDLTVTGDLTVAGDAQGNSNSMARQAIMNGNFDVWQRGTSFTPGSGDFTADRWGFTWNADGGSFPSRDATREDLTPGDIDNCRYYLSQTFNGTGSSLGNNWYYKMTQKIENGTRYLCGASKTVTVSFWAKSDIADKQIGVSLIQDYGSGGSPTADEVLTGEQWTLTSSWTQYTYTFTTNTLSGKTFGTADDDHLHLDFWFGWGDTIGDTYGLTGAEDFGGSGSVDIAQVQLCAGSVALPFQPKSYEDELRACQRYCQAFSTAAGIIGWGQAGTTTYANINVPLKGYMRTIPTLTATAGDWQLIDNNSAAVDVTTLAIDTSTDSEFIIPLNTGVASGLTQFRPYSLKADGGGTRLLVLSAEL